MVSLKIAGIVIGILALVAFIAKGLKKSPERYYKRAMGCHKKGEYYYSQGDMELANDYYTEAEELRKKAEELQEVV